MKRIEVVASIIKSGEKIFATERGYGEFKGFWEFPGGKIEANETREQALVRELKEELAVEIKVENYTISLNSSHHWINPSKTVG